MRAILLASATAPTLAPRHELGEPGIFPRLLHGPSQDGVRADDENATQIAVASLGDRSKLMLASARFLPRHQSDPGRKIASRSKNRRVCNRCRNRGRPDDADARDGLEPLARRVGAMLHFDLLLE